MAPTPAPEVVTIITRMNVGGPARLAILLAAGIPETGHLVLTGDPGPSEGSLESQAAEAGIRIQHVPGLRRAISPLQDLRALVWLVRYLRRNQPRIVATHMAKAGLLGRLAAIAAGVPVRIHTFHGHVLEGYFGPGVSRSIRWAERLLAGFSTCLVAVSPEIAAELARMRIGPDRITVIRVGVDLLPARRGRLRAELGLDESPVVGFVGRLTDVKGPDVFLEVAASVHSRRPAARFVVVGDGELRQQLRKQASRLGLDEVLQFTGWREDLEDVLSDCDLIVCSSRHEGTPLVVIEAAALGVPAVASRVGGLPDIIRDGVNGFLRERGDVAGLAGAVELLIDEPERRRAMGQSARRTYRERYSGARMVRETRAVYRQHLGAPGL